MSTITWLHISDLHWRRSQAYDAQIVAHALLDDLAHRDKITRDGELARIDFIFFTGDLAFASQPEEYKLARQFLTELLRITRVRKSRLFIVPGNHDVDRTAISVEVQSAIRRAKDQQAINSLLDNKTDRTAVMRRFHYYRGFCNDYLGRYLPFDHSRYFYVKERTAGGRQVAILGLNSAWASSSNRDRNRLLLGERQVRDALEQARAADLRIALMHHPFEWLQDFDRADCESLLLGGCHYILLGHLHDTNLMHLQGPGVQAMVIGAGACYDTRAYPNAYNLVHLDLDSGQGTIYLRRYSNRQGGFWTQDVLRYREVPGQYTFKLASDQVVTSDTRLVEQEKEPDRVRPHKFVSWPPVSKLQVWLAQKGLREHPFAQWNARVEEMENLSAYFVDVGNLFDELLETKTPCIVFAAQGCGKTAYRQILAAQCWPPNRNSQILAINYTYANFEQVLIRAGHDCERIESHHCIVELLRQGLHTINSGAQKDPSIQKTIEQLPDLENLSDDALLSYFAGLVRDRGLRSCVVLIDEIDRLEQTAGDPVRQMALLSPLLGTLPRIEQSDLAFKFFLPSRLESTLRLQKWFGLDDLSIFRIKWNADSLQKLVSQRLRHYSAKSDPPYTQLGQLCEDDLAMRIDHELVELAEGRPRWVIRLANMLFRTHCKQADPPPLIALDTWKTVRAEWTVEEADFAQGESPPTSPQTSPDQVIAAQAVYATLEKPPQELLVKLRRILDDYFDEEELRTLCFDLGVKYDNLPGKGAADKARELVAHLGRHGRIAELVTAIKRERKAIPWEDAPGDD